MCGRTENTVKLFDIGGHRAIVTGGTRGLGHGAAEGLLEAGARVVIFGTSSRAETVAAEFRAKGYDCRGLIVDVSSHEQRVSGFQKAVELLGGLDILVNAAGVQRRCRCEDFTASDWNDVLNVNLTASFELCQLAIREFEKKEEGYGKIVNFASMASFFGGTNIAAYAASKGGVAQFSKSLCNEVAAKGICVNCIAPGYMDTDLNVELTDPANPRFTEISSRIPAGRWGTPDDVKGLVVFLSSHASDYINGTVIPCDGGYLVK